MKVVEEYLIGEKPHHHVVEDYIKSDYYCPACGNKEVWEKQGEGDYYLGVDYICTVCGGKHLLDHCGGSAKIEILNQLRSGITAVSNSRTLGS